MSLTLLSEDTTGMSFAIHRHPSDLTGMPAAMKAAIVAATEQRLQGTECSLKLYPGYFPSGYFRLDIVTQIEDTLELSRRVSWKILTDDDVVIDKKNMREGKFASRTSSAGPWRNPVTESILFERYYTDTLVHPIRAAEVKVSVLKRWYLQQRVLRDDNVGDTIRLGSLILRLARMTQDFATLDVLAGTTGGFGYKVLDKNLRESSRDDNFYGSPRRDYLSFYDIFTKELVDLFYEHPEFDRDDYQKAATPAARRMRAYQKGDITGTTLVFNVVGYLDALHLYTFGEVYRDERTIRCPVEQVAIIPKAKPLPQSPRLEDLPRTKKQNR